jgi:hypothetical protein
MYYMFYFMYKTINKNKMIRLVEYWKIINKERGKKLVYLESNINVFFINVGVRTSLHESQLTPHALKSTTM